MRTDALANPAPRRRASSTIAVVVALLLLALSYAASPAAAQLVTSGSSAERPVTSGEAANAMPPPPTSRVDDPTAFAPGPIPSPLSPGMQLPDLSSRENFSAAMQIIILLTILSLAPAILIMMTSFTRIIIVLSLLRQALGTQQLPPNQVLIGLSMFMTFLVMGPTWQRVNNEALQPYMNGTMSQRDALRLAQVPVREFMLAQIQAGGNDEDVFLFHEFAHPEAGKLDEIPPEQVGTMTLVPAFMLSELKTAFLLGFKVYLPFLIIDMVISAVLISMGMMMLPPVLISLPFKLLLFVLVDGWRLITGSLMGTFVPS